ncbi:MAG TPA: ATP-binding cassette domain-containing protein [Actinomycetes bacterium]|nr:ATP-binding cassette domain-containing protein [Actinomycetes bacterium]
MATTAATTSSPNSGPTGIPGRVTAALAAAIVCDSGQILAIGWRTAGRRWTARLAPLSMRVGREQTVLDGLSLEVRAGETVSIVGPSGCGKTTLLNLMGALDRPDAGTVRCCGIDLTTADRATLTAYRAREVGFVFQFYNLLPTLTVLENVEAGLTVAGIGRAEAMAAGIGQAWFRIGLHPAPTNFALVIALAIALALLATPHAVRRVLRLDIAGAVRARLIG